MKMGIIGAGHIARTMSHTINEMPGVTPYAIASRDISKARKYAKEFNFERAYGSYEELVSDPETELVYIATPHSFHYEHIMLCLKHKKHVLCEKAFTLNAAQAEEAISYARANGLLLAEAIWTRYLPMRNTMDNILKSGIIGAPQSLYATLSYPITDKARITDLSLGGGALLDIGVYCINFASMVFGGNIDKISAQAVLYPTGADAADSISFTYPDGRMAVLHCDARAACNKEGAVYGDKGYVIFNNINNCEGITVYDSSCRVIDTYSAPLQITGFEYQVQACIDAINSGLSECPQMPHREIIRMMKIMDEIRRQTGVVYPGENS